MKTGCESCDRKDRLMAAFEEWLAEYGSGINLEGPWDRSDMLEAWFMGNAHDGARVVARPADEREAFEAWYTVEFAKLAAPGSSANFIRDEKEPDHYANPFIQEAWDAWSARAAGVVLNGQMQPIVGPDGIYSANTLTLGGAPKMDVQTVLRRLSAAVAALAGHLDKPVTDATYPLWIELNRAQKAAKRVLGEQPTKPHFTNERLREKIASDPDDEPMAGGAPEEHKRPPQQVPCHACAGMGFRTHSAPGHISSRTCGSCGGSGLERASNEHQQPNDRS